MTPKSFRLLPGLPKAMPKNKHKNQYTNINKKEILEPTWSKIGCQNRDALVTVCNIVLQDCFRTLPGGCRTPKIITNLRKTPFACHLIIHVCICCSIRFAEEVGVRGDSHCNYPRLQLYLPSLGKVTMLTHFPQLSEFLCSSDAFRMLFHYVQHLHICCCSFLSLRL